MLRISKLADYAFVILAQMTSKTGENWSASALAVKTTLPLPTVAKLMKLLARGGVVAAQRGATGGYRLARDAREISVAQIIEAVDGPIRLTECAGHPLKSRQCTCAVYSLCPLCAVWGRVNGAVRESLGTVLLSDFAER